ncbi:unnamed protein product, partial [Allacma fusca]
SVEGDGKNLTVLFNNQPLHTPALGLNVLSNALLNYFGEKNKITVYNHPFNLHAKDEAFTKETWGSSLLVGISTCLTGAFMAAAFVILPVLEQLSKSKHLQQIAGVRLPVYWLAEFLVSLGV